MYLYLSHDGDIYVSARRLSPIDLYCEVCYAYDNYLGEVFSIKDVENELQKLLDNKIGFHCDFEDIRKEIRRYMRTKKRKTE